MPVKSPSKLLFFPEYLFEDVEREEDVIFTRKRREMFTLEWKTDACFLLSRLRPSNDLLELHPFPGFAFSRTDAF